MGQEIGWFHEGKEMGNRLGFKNSQVHFNWQCSWFLLCRELPEVWELGVLRAGKAIPRRQHPVHKGLWSWAKMVECLLSSYLPLLTADTVGGRCGSLRVGGCVSGPLWGVCVSTPDQTPGKQTSHSREGWKEALNSFPVTAPASQEKPGVGT